MRASANRPRIFLPFVLGGVLVCFLIFSFVPPAAAGGNSTRPWSIAVYDRLLRGARSDSEMITLGDMQVRASVVRAWRNQLVAEEKGVQGGGIAPDSATPAGLVKWPGGTVYYAFASDVTTNHQRDYKDAAAEWTTFANIHFVQRTNQANYSYVQNAAISGGQSAVGMVGGAQTFLIGSDAWNRYTLLHEIGHTLGLIHEHQRSDRDTYVNILTANVQGGASNGNFTLVPDSLNNGAYDFYSVMHYRRDAISIDPATLNTIEPQSTYASFLNVYGQQYDRPLSKGDRDGMAAMYGAGPVLTSVVTNTLDSGAGSLRAALYYAFDHPSTTITFNIPTTDTNFTGKVWNIYPSDALFSPGNNTVVDGSSQPGNTNTLGPEIAVSGSNVHPPDSYASGLKLIGSNVTIRGLIINKFPGNGVDIMGAAATGNKIAGCFIGTAYNGTASPNAFSGIVISAGASGNTIGGSVAADHNIVSGNTNYGIYLTDPGTANNSILNNYIGTSSSGSVAVPNQYAGIGIFNGVTGTVIGGSSASVRNTISGNTNEGIVIGDATTSGNIISGNYIGLNSTGYSALPNGWAGIDLYGGTTGNLIGGANSSARNVISGNGAQGISISGVGTSGNTVSANFIGINAGATLAVGNTYAGIQIYGGATNNLIGGDVNTNTRNFISGNKAQGIAISDVGTTGNFVVGNFVGPGSSGTTAFANAYGGVDIFGGATANTIGGPTAYTRNTISGNTYHGIAIAGTGTDSNYVGGNYIGIQFSGNGLLPNNGTGISIYGGAKNNFIGVTANRGAPGTSVARNYIAGNINQGITLSDPGTSGNSITSNYIGLNPAAVAGYGNGWSGVDIFNGASGNFIGKVTFKNYICSNGNYGISLSGSATKTNSVISNYIGVNANLVSLGNTWSGMALFGGPTGNIIGGVNSGEGNTIVGNGLRGIDIFDAATTGNALKGNVIYNNGGIPINLVGGTEDGYGVTANDATDSDTGPNSLQNYPVLTTASSGSGTAIAGTLKTGASHTYHLEFFSSTVADASGHGGSQKFLFYKTYATDATGNLNFNFTYSITLSPGTILSATATSPFGDTSEFSQNITVTSGS